ncbi:MAG: hypothetical protein ACOZBZ_01115 [Patescibacteria group bacterium]
MKWKIGFFVLLFLLIIETNIFAWYLYFKSRTPISPSASITPTLTVLPTPTPTIDETALIKQAVYKKTGLDQTKAEVTINKNTGKHATGNIKEYEAVGGAYWLAAKTATGWVCVYDGQANPKCSEIAPYNFPKDMVPECLDANGKVVKR